MLIYLWYLKGGHLFETRHLFGTVCLFLFEKQPNVQNKTLIFNLKGTITETVTEQIYNECSVTTASFDSVKDLTFHPYLHADALYNVRLEYFDH